MGKDGEGTGLRGYLGQKEQGASGAPLKRKRFGNDTDCNDPPPALLHRHTRSHPKPETGKSKRHFIPISPIDEGIRCEALGGNGHSFGSVLRLRILLIQYV